MSGNEKRGRVHDPYSAMCVFALRNITTYNFRYILPGSSDTHMTPDQAQTQGVAATPVSGHSGLRHYAAPALGLRVVARGGSGWRPLGRSPALWRAAAGVPGLMRGSAARRPPGRGGARPA